MAWQTGAKIELSEKQAKILREYAKGTHTRLHLKTRSKIIIMSAEGKSNNGIEKALGIDAKTVKKWRDRYSVEHEELREIEQERPQKLRKAIEKTLTDEQRAGSPAKFRDEQVAAILAMACEEPSKYELPFSHWTAGMLQREVIKSGIVESISVRQVGRFLKRERFTAP